MSLGLGSWLTLAAVGMVVWMVVVLGLANFCADPLGTAHISEGEANRIKERNEDLADSLPVFDSSRRVLRSQGTCEGAYKHLVGSACSLRLAYETDEPLAGAIVFYEDYFGEQGWRAPENLKSVKGRYFKKDGLTVQLYAWTPPFVCPDPDLHPEASEACDAEWIETNGGRYSITIHPTRAAFQRGSLTWLPGLRAVT